MSTRSRANPWFRPVLPIAYAIRDGLVADVGVETLIRPTILAADGEPIRDEATYEQMCRARVRAMVRSRLDNKIVLTARLLDPAFDEECLALCPELGRLDPVTSGALRETFDRIHATD